MAETLKYILQKSRLYDKLNVKLSLSLNKHHEDVREV